MSSSNRQRLMLIDGHSMAFRAYYALPVDNFSTTGGQHTNAVYGFISMLASLLSEEQPTHLAVAFDVGRTTFRTRMFPEYKAQRDATPEPFKGQVELIKDVLHALGITTLEHADFEADDIIGTLATAATDFDTLLVTGDRDYLQLVNDTTTVLYPKRGVSQLTRFTPAAVAEKYGLTPAQYPDFAALRGDPSDNLPGIPRVGEKTAQKWIRTYGTLDNLIEHAADIKGQAGSNFRERLDQVRMNRTLTAMITDMDLEVTPADLGLGQADVAQLSTLFDDLQFGVTLRERILAVIDHDGEALPQTPVATVQRDAEPLASWLQARAGQPLAVGVAGRGKPGQGDLTEFVLVDANLHALVIDPTDLDFGEELALTTWVESDSEPKYFHDAKAAFHMFQGRGLNLRGIAHDTMLAAYLVRPGQRTYELADVVQRHLQRSFADNDGLLEQTAVLWPLVERLIDELHGIEGYPLYADLELPLLSILARMETAGIAVNRPALEEQLANFEARVAHEETQARELVELPALNLGSPKQLQEVLFGQLSLPKTKKTKTGYSTAAKEIEQLAEKHPHPFLDHLLAFREFQKMKTTVEGLIKTIGDDGRIHTTYKQTAASTGRLSSTDPNLQNIPVRTDYGKRIREAFVVGKGFETLLTADYSQIEMRVMAHLSQDKGLIEAYREGEDLHNYVGSKVFDVPIDGVTPELRRRVKAMSYGLVYGLSAFGLAQQLGISGGEAKRIMESYFERFGGVQRYLSEVVDKARKDGYTATLFGRRRYLPELTSTNRVARENAERAALNAPIQGTAADIIKVAMVRVDQRLKDARVSSRVLLQVHDELVVEIAPGELEEVRAIVEEEMDSAITLRVPLEVSAGEGANWNAAGH